MEYSRAGFDVNGEVQGFMVDVGSLYDFLSRLEDRRDARGIRYKLAHILVFVVLAKLAGEDRLTGISEWVRHRKEALAKALGLRRPQAPHRTTYSRIFGEKAGRGGVRGGNEQLPGQRPKGWTTGAGSHRRQGFAGQHTCWSDPGSASDGGLSSR